MRLPTAFTTLLTVATATLSLGVATPATAQAAPRTAGATTARTAPLVTGLATTTVTGFRSLSTAIGGAKSRRSYQGGPTAPPSSYSTSCAGIDPSLGVRLSIASFKADPIATARGAYDRQMASLAASSPAGTAWAYWHEPEGPTGDMPGATDNARADAFTAAASRMARVMKRANPKVRVGVIFTISLWWKNSGHDPHRWLSTASSTGARVPLPIDWIGIDGYNSYGLVNSHGTVRPWNEAPAIFGQSLDWLDKYRPGWGKRVTETGSTADPANPGRRAAWITRTWSYLHSRGVYSVVYWSATHYEMSRDARAVAALKAANLAHG